MRRTEQALSVEIPMTSARAQRGHCTAWTRLLLTG
jgi:hypothetical protein